MSQHKQGVAALAGASDVPTVLSKQKRVPRSTLPLDAVLLKADGKDLVKKSSVRKGRYLLIFNGQLAPLAGGRLGVLAQLDTQTPTMYLEFPQGRMKLFGRLVFPKNKYIVLKAGHKDILCEDIFDMLVVFSSAWWIGNKADNVKEEQLPMPNDILHNNQPGQASVFDRPSSLAVTGRPRSKSRSPRASVSRSQDSDDSDSDAAVHLTQTLPSQRSSGRRTVKRPRYAEASSEADDVEDEAEKMADEGVSEPADSAWQADEGGEDGPSKPARKRQKPEGRPQRRDAASKHTPGRGTGKKARAPAVISIISDEEDQETEEHSNALQNGKSTPNKAKQRPAAGKGKQTTLPGAWTASAKGDHLGQDASQPTQSQRSVPGRAAKANAEQRLQQDADSEESEIESESADDDTNDDSGYD